MSTHDQRQSDLRAASRLLHEHTTRLPHGGYREQVTALARRLGESAHKLSIATNRMYYNCADAHTAQVSHDDPVTETP